MFVSLVNILNKSCQRKQYIGNYQKDSILLIMYSYNVLAGILKEILKLKTWGNELAVDPALGPIAIGLDQHDQAEQDAKYNQ